MNSLLIKPQAYYTWYATNTMVCRLCLDIWSCLLLIFVYPTFSTVSWSCFSFSFIVFFCAVDAVCGSFSHKVLLGTTKVTFGSSASSWKLYIDAKCKFLYSFIELKPQVPGLFIHVVYDFYQNTVLYFCIFGCLATGISALVFTLHDRVLQAIMNVLLQSAHPYPFLQ